MQLLFVVTWFDFYFNRREYLFNFDDKFEIHDDIEVLKRMGMDLGKFLFPITRICSNQAYP